MAPTSAITPGAPAEPVLVAWGVTTTGSPVLLGLAPGSDEGTDPWAGFLEALSGGGLGAPLLVITDGAPGLIGAVELAFPRSLRQRCLIHRARNVLAKVPNHAQAEVKAAFWEIFDDITADPGDQAVAEARRRAGAFADRYQHRYPGAVACLLDTLPELTVFLRFPREHRHRIRHTNPDRADLRRDQTADQGDRSAARRAVLPMDLDPDRQEEAADDRLAAGSW